MNKKYFSVIILFSLAIAANFWMRQIIRGEPAGKNQEYSISNLEGLENFAKVSETLYRGAQPTALGFAELKKMGVKTVVNLRGFHSDKKLLRGLGFKYVHISFKPWHPEDEDIIKFLKVVTNPDNCPIFIHCQHGADRTGTMVAVYRMYVQGWTYEKALSELPKFGFHESGLECIKICLHPEF
ncbi:MAG: dual specificity protein phosphatase family protein [Elusimicrobiota bacterium]